MLAALLLLAASPQAAPAAPATVIQADPALATQANALIAVLDGRGNYDSYFAPSFRAAVPRTRFSPILDQLRTALGKPLKIEALRPTSAWVAELTVGYERGTAAMRIAIDPGGAHAVTGLLVTGTALRDDSFARLDGDFRALPGASGYAVYALDAGAPRAIAGYNAEAPAPLGSAFKLWVLAEAARQVNAGQRRWADVVPVGAPSLPSGILQAWPAGTPVTLQTLATLMISISDNTATDTLMHALGRDAIDAAAGPAAPLLTTREAFVIKADPALTKAWVAADTAGRHALLAANARRFAAARIDPGMFSGLPLAIDSVEWFASPHDIARLLDSLRRTGGPTARAILAVNPGADKATAARFAYMGFKGGSEPGVIALNFLARDPAGHWYAVTGNWHRTDGDVRELIFLGLMTRALALVAPATHP